MPGPSQLSGQRLWATINGGKQPKAVLPKRGTEPAGSELEALSYDCSAPVGGDGAPVRFGGGSQRTEPTESGLKRREKALKARAAFAKAKAQGLGNGPAYRAAMEAAGVSDPTARGYVAMGEREVEALALGKAPSATEAAADNLIYKMLRDGLSGPVVLAYAMRELSGRHAGAGALASRIESIAEANFPGRADCRWERLVEERHPDGVQRFTPGQVARHFLTIDGGKLAAPIEESRAEVLALYPGLEAAMGKWRAYHSAMMGGDPAAVREFIQKNHGDEYYGSLCRGLEGDLDAVLNGVTSDLNSGFVEGCNNKFKLLKRIVYGRAGIVKMAKRCALYFLRPGRFDAMRTVREGRVYLGGFPEGSAEGVA